MEDHQFQWIFDGVLCGVFLVVLPSCGSNSHVSSSHPSTNSVSIEAPVQKEDALNYENITSVADIPSRIDYRLPKEFGDWDPRKPGSESGRENLVVKSPSGASRFIQVLAPHHPDDTPPPVLNPSPTLFWYVPVDIEFPVEFKIRNSRNETVKKIVIPPDIPKGIHEISLGEQGFALEKDEKYRWSVNGKLNPLEPDSNIYSSVAIRLREGGKADLVEELKGKPNLDKAYAINIKAEKLAFDGYWYDAFMMISDLLKTYPGACNFVESRSKLLSKKYRVSLRTVAKDLSNQAGCPWTLNEVAF